MAIYYVHPDGNDGNTGLGTTTALAWQTIAHASDTATSADDVINIMAGTYSASDSGAVLRTSASGTAGHPITFQRYGTDAVILRNQNTGIYLGHNYITIDGLRVENASQAAGMTYGCTCANAVHHGILKNCTFKYMRSGDPSFGIDWQYMTDGKIQNCTVDYVGTPQSAGTESGNGIGLAGGRNLVENCTIDHCGHCGTFTTGAGVGGGSHIVRNNTVIGTWGICGEFLEYGTTDNPLLVENNIFRNASGLEDGVYPNSAWQQQGSRTIFRRNQIYSSIGPGVAFYSNTNYNAKYNRFYHNIIYNCGYGGGSGITYGPYEFSEVNNGTQEDNKIHNSIHYANARVDHASYAGYAVAGDHTESACTWNGTNPLFISAPTNFALQEGSPCINAGGWLTTIISATGSGTSFVVNDAKYFCDGFDIPGVSGDEIQLQGDTTTVRVTDVNYTTNTITVASSVSWTLGDGVAIGLTA